MLDINFIRENTDLVERVATDKNVDVDIKKLLSLDEKRRDLQTNLDGLRRDKKDIANSTKGKPSEKMITEGKNIRDQIQALEEEFKEIERNYDLLMMTVPNLPSSDTPIGKDEDGNEVLRETGKRPNFDFEAKEHFILGKELGIIEMEKAADVSGARFAYLKGELVWLQLGLLMHAFNVLGDEDILKKIATDADLDVPTKPFVPIIPPVMVKPEVMQAMGRLEPKDERYYIESDDLFLVGSAEHTIGPLHMSETIAGDELPIRYVGYSTSFRREAGSYGKDLKGIIRLHQFDKIEIESFTSTENSTDEQNFIVAIQEYLMASMKIPYQVVLKCTGDMGTPNARAIDIEAWMPGQNKYRETHTSDLMTDYQSRRLRIKYKNDSGESKFVHMNDATVFAIGRTLVAIMENYQQKDGSIEVPDVLQKYVPFKKIG